MAEIACRVLSHRGLIHLFLMLMDALGLTTLADADDPANIVIAFKYATNGPVLAGLCAVEEG